MTNQEKAIARFLRSESAKQIVAFTLHNAGTGSKGFPVERFDIVEALAPEDYDRLAETICARAQDDADGTGPTLQRYVLYSLVDGDRPSARVPFRVKGNPDMDLDGESEGGEEAPDSKGLTRQLMRHNEAMARTMAQMVQSVGVIQTRRMESQENVINRLLEDRLKAFEVLEEARSEQAERQLLLESEKAKEGRIDKAIDKAMLLGPVLLSYFTSGKIASKDTPESLLIKELVSTLTVEQFQAIAKTLAPAQQVAFFSLIEKMQKANKTDSEATPSNGVS